jgi:hypothetical protein
VAVAVGYIYIVNETELCWHILDYCGSYRLVNCDNRGVGSPSGTDPSSLWRRSKVFDSFRWLSRVPLIEDIHFLRAKILISDMYVDHMLALRFPSPRSYGRSITGSSRTCPSSLLSIHISAIKTMKQIE